jgi:hypothetical protein
MLRRALPLLAAAALLAPRAASAFIGVEGFYGISRPPTTTFNAAVSGAASAPDLFKSSLQLAGGDVLVNLGALEFGAIIDTTFGSNTASQTAIGALGGLLLGDETLRIDLLAEAGGHRYGNFLEQPEIVTASSKDEWFFYVGLRPGVAFKLGGGPVFLGLWAFVRWDVTTKNVPVTVGSANAEGSYKLGGTTIGATLRLGLEF